MKKLTMGGCLVVIVAGVAGAAGTGLAASSVVEKRQMVQTTSRSAGADDAAGHAGGLEARRPAARAVPGNDVRHEEMGRARAEAAMRTWATGMAERAIRLSDRIEPDQRAALVRAAEGWQAISGAPDMVFMGRVERDVRGILPAAEADELMELVGAPSAEEESPGLSCFVSSKVGLVFSVVGMLSSEAIEATRTATEDAWKASASASVCYANGSVTCPGAAEFASSSAASWAAQVGACALAGAAALTEHATSIACTGKE